MLLLAASRGLYYSNVRKASDFPPRGSTADDISKNELLGYRIYPLCREDSIDPNSSSLVHG